MQVSIQKASNLLIDFKQYFHFSFFRDRLVESYAVRYYFSLLLNSFIFKSKYSTSLPNIQSSSGKYAIQKSHSKGLLMRKILQKYNDNYQQICQNIDFTLN